MKRFDYVTADPGIPVPGRKGASIHVESVCRALVGRGLAGRIFTTRRGAPELCGLPVFQLPGPSAANGDHSREIARFLAGLDAPDVGGEGCDFIYERYSLWHLGGLARARRAGLPFILEVNSPLPDEARRFRDLEQVELAVEIGRVLLRKASGVVCVSEGVADWVREQRGGEEGVWVVPNGVDVELFAPGEVPRRPPLPPAPVPVIAFTGSFRPWHGTADLLKAFALVAGRHAGDVRLLCIGDGPQRDAFEENARALGIGERVHVTGMVDHREVPAWMGCADIAVAPYPRLERFYFSPLKIFEAMALGLPVVAADLGQVPEIVAHDERGRIYRAGDASDLAQALLHLLRNREESRRLGRNGRQWVLRHATWASRVGSILSRIDSL